MVAVDEQRVSRDDSPRSANGPNGVFYLLEHALSLQRVQQNFERRIRSHLSFQKLGPLAWIPHGSSAIGWHHYAGA